LKEAEINPVHINPIHIQVPQIVKVTINPPIAEAKKKPVIQLENKIKHNFDVITIFNTKDEKFTHRDILVPEVDYLTLELNGVSHDDELHERITSVGYDNKTHFIQETAKDFFVEIFSGR